MKLGLISVRLVGAAVALGFDPRTFGDVLVKDWISRRPKRAPRAGGSRPAHRRARDVHFGRRVSP